MHSPLVAFLHQLHGLGPPLDHLVRGKGRGRPTLVRRVKFLAVDEGAAVVAHGGARDQRRLGWGRCVGQHLPPESNQEGILDCGILLSVPSGSTDSIIIEN